MAETHDNADIPPEHVETTPETSITAPREVGAAADQVNGAGDDAPGMPAADAGMMEPPSSQVDPELARREARLAEQERALSAREAALAAAERPRRPRRLRRFLVGLLVFLTCVSFLASTVTIWAHQTLLNTDRFVATIQPITADPVLRAAVSSAVADRIVSTLKIQDRVTAALPPKASFVAAPVTTAVSDFIRNITNGVLGSQAFQRFWLGTVRTVHSQLVALLRGDTRNVVIENGQLKLNLYPLIVRTLDRLQTAAPKLVPLKAPLPTSDEAASPAVARQKLSQALGVQLPPTFGEIVLAQSDQLDKAQQYVRQFDFLVIAIPVLTFVLAGAAILLSLDRRRTLITIGIGILVAFVLALLLIQAAENRVYAAVTNGTAQDVVRVAIPALLNDLVNLATLLAVVGGLVAIAAYLAGQPAWLMRLLAHIQHGTPPTTRASGGTA